MAFRVNLDGAGSITAMPYDEDAFNSCEEANEVINQGPRPIILVDDLHELEILGIDVETVHVSYF